MVPETDTIARRGHPNGLPPIGCETGFHVLLEKFRCGERVKASQAKVLSHMVFDSAEAKPVEIFGEGKAVFGWFSFRQLLSERKGGPACPRTVAACCRLNKWGRGHSTCPTQRRWLRFRFAFQSCECLWERQEMKRQNNRALQCVLGTWWARWHQKKQSLSYLLLELLSFSGS